MTTSPHEQMKPIVNLRHWRKWTDENGKKWYKLDDEPTETELEKNDELVYLTGFGFGITILTPLDEDYRVWTFSNFAPSIRTPLVTSIRSYHISTLTKDAWSIRKVADQYPYVSLYERETSENH